MAYKPNKTHSKRQRARLLALIATEPMTVNELSAALYLSYAAVKKHIDFMRGGPVRQLYIADHKRHPAGGARTPRYLAGNLPDVEFKYIRELRKTRHLITQENDERIMALLEVTAMTADQLVVKMGKSISTVRRSLNRLHDDKRIYISSWASVTQQVSARWSIGNLPDAPRAPYLYQARIARRTQASPFAALGV